MVFIIHIFRHYISCWYHVNCKCDIVKRNYYTACNSILSICGLQNELIKLFLFESFCLPILQYGSSAVKYNKTQRSALNACWNAAYWCIFDLRKHGLVWQFIMGLGRLDFFHLCLLSTLKFHRKFYCCNNLVLARLHYVKFYFMWI